MLERPTRLAATCAIVVFATIAHAAPAPVAVDLTADVAGLPPGERAALGELVRATAVMEGLFLRQVWAGNEALLAELANDESPAGQALLQRVRHENGPWLRRDRDRPFVEGIGEKPLVGSFYPAGSTRAELDTWLSALDADGHAAATSPVTTIRRAPTGLIVVPYSREYQPELARAAAHLRKAAALTADKPLAAFLELRAGAFAGNDYHASDLAWMKLDGVIEPSLGPHEIDEDGWFNAKASFQGFVTVRHARASAELGLVRARLQALEDQLPLPPEQRTRDIAARPGAAAPIRIADLIFAAGDDHRALATGAYVLPNDERITASLGSKRVILRNVHEARWRALIAPLARARVAPALPASFAAYFHHLVTHELMHLIGPRQIVVKGRRTSVTESLHETYGVIEEAKADVLALWALFHLADAGVVPKAIARELPGAVLAAMIERLRFGPKDVHAQGLALTLDTLLERGAVTLGKAGVFSADAARWRATVRELATELLSIEATGDRSRASALIKARAKLRPEVKAALAGLADRPLEIAPRYVTAKALRGR